MERSTTLKLWNAHRTGPGISAFSPLNKGAGIADALRADCVYLMQNIAGSSHLQNNMDHLLRPFLYTISTTHCMTVSLAQNGAGLGTMWGEEKAREMLEEAGFKEVELKQLPHDFFNSYYIAKKA